MSKYVMFIPTMRQLIEAINLNEEDWRVVVIYGVETAVGWRRDKDAGNKISHRGLSLADGVPVITDVRSRSALQYRNGQERQIYAGYGPGDRRLYVVTEWLEEFDFPAVRVISVRDYESSDKHEFDMNEDANDPVIDPDNPPMTGKEVWVPAKELFLKKYAETKARIEARKKAEQAANKSAAE